MTKLVCQQCMMVRMCAKIQQNYDLHLVGSELCGVWCVLRCVRVQVPGPRSDIQELGSGACPVLLFRFAFEKSVMSDFY
jgi:hypothetical protein